MLDEVRDFIRSQIQKTRKETIEEVMREIKGKCSLIEEIFKNKSEEMKNE